MRPLDEELRELFRRKEPPAGFEERVLARLAGHGQRGLALQPGCHDRKDPLGGPRASQALTPGPQSRSVLSVLTSFWTQKTRKIVLARWLAAAAACVLIIAGVVRYRHEQRMRAQAEQASRQAIMALQFAGTQLDMALQQANQAEAEALSPLQHLEVIFNERNR